MRSMQENFVLIESSLKLKNDNLLQQLGEYEVKLAEAKARIFQLESGAGIASTPAVEELQFRIQKLEQSNRQLVDEKYELQKNIAELQDRIVSKSAVSGDDKDSIEKDNRIRELEDLLEEQKRSRSLTEESKIELQRQATELSSKNEEYSSKIVDLEKQISEMRTERSVGATGRLSDETPREDETVTKLTKELEQLNRSMIRLRAQHKSKVKNLQKQLENFTKVRARIIISTSGCLSERLRSDSSAWEVTGRIIAVRLFLVKKKNMNIGSLHVPLHAGKNSIWCIFCTDIRHERGTC